MTLGISKPQPISPLSDMALLIGSIPVIIMKVNPQLTAQVHAKTEMKANFNTPAAWL